MVKAKKSKKAKKKARRPRIRTDDQKQRRRHALTFHTEPNWTIVEAEFADPMETKTLRYFVSGREIAPTTGKVHWQSYAEWFKPMSFTAIKKFFRDNTVHIENAKFDFETNKGYCMKDGDFKEFGTPACMTQGERVDLVSVRDHYEAGGTHRQLVDNGEHLMTIARYSKFCGMLKSMYTEPRSTMTELHIYWGPTGTGKTSRANFEAREFGTVYFKPAGKWWDGYEQEDSVLIEDFRGEIALAEMLRLIDRMPLRVQVKGGFEHFTSKRVYITSNTSPDEWFNTMQKGYDRSIAAFKRRITHIEEMQEKWEGLDEYIKENTIATVEPTEEDEVVS